VDAVVVVVEVVDVVTKLVEAVVVVVAENNFFNISKITRKQKM